MNTTILKKIAFRTSLFAFAFCYSQEKPKVMLDNFFNNEKQLDKATGEI